MTVSVPAYTEKEWIGDGSTTAFQFQTKVPEAADIKVWLRDGDALTLQALGTHYSLSGLGDPSGVAISFVTAPAGGKVVRARRTTVAKQTIDYGNLIKVPGDTTEAQLDRFAMALQDHQSVIDLQLNISDLAESAAESADIATEQADRAENEADRAEGYAAATGAASGLLVRKTVSLLLADAVFSYTVGVGKTFVGAGDIITAQGFRYEVAASGATDHHVTTAGGVKLYVLLTDAGEWNILAFGASTVNADNFDIIQAVIDLRGTVIIPDDPAGGGEYLIRDTGLVRSNTTIRWTGNTFTKLSQPSTIGQVFAAYHEGPVGAPTGNSANVAFINPLIDGGDLGYVVSAPYGENGVGGAFCDWMVIRGGTIKNCRNGQSAWSGTGGKGIQIENTVSNCAVEGVRIMDCTIGCETGGAAATPATNIHYSNLTMLRCDTMICGRHSASPPTAGVNVNSAVFEDIVGYNCGKTTGYWADQGVQVGAIAVDRVNNFDILNVTIFNEVGYGEISCVVRHLKGNYNKFVVSFWGDAENLINSESIPDGFGASGSRDHNRYELRHAYGAADRVLVTLSGDGAGNIYKVKTATLNTELFDADAAQPDLFGFFENAAGDKVVDGPLNFIHGMHARNYPATFSRARVGSLQLNNIYYSFTTGAQVTGTAVSEDLVLTRNQVEKLRVTSTGLRVAVPVYADNAAATAAGLAAGDIYKTATGEVRIRV
jgi:hypothetical protein